MIAPAACAERVATSGSSCSAPSPGSTAGGAAPLRLDRRKPPAEDLGEPVPVERDVKHPRPDVAAEVSKHRAPHPIRRPGRPQKRQRPPARLRTDGGAKSAPVAGEHVPDRRCSHRPGAEHERGHVARRRVVLHLCPDHDRHVQLLKRCPWGGCHGRDRRHHHHRVHARIHQPPTGLHALLGGADRPDGHHLVAAVAFRAAAGRLSFGRLLLDQVFRHALVRSRKRGQKSQLHSTAQVYPTLIAPSSTIVAAVR